MDEKSYYSLWLPGQQRSCASHRRDGPSWRRT